MEETFLFGSMPVEGQRWHEITHYYSCRAAK